MVFNVGVSGWHEPVWGEKAATETTYRWGEEKAAVHACQGQNSGNLQFAIYRELYG